MTLLLRTLWRLTAILTLIPLVFNTTVAQELEEEEEQPKIAVGDQAPDFTAEDMDGNEFTLSEMIGEKPVVLDFWATWCPPCRREMPLISEFAEKYKDEVLVYSITSESAESREGILSFIKDNELKQKFIHDPSGSIADKYFVYAIPYVVAIDIDGKVVGTFLGFSENIVEELEEALGFVQPEEVPSEESEKPEEEGE